MSGLVTYNTNTSSAPTTTANTTKGGTDTATCDLNTRVDPLLPYNHVGSMLNCGAPSDQFHILLQAQALMLKNNHYRQIDNSLRYLNSYRPSYHLIPLTSESDDIVTSALRDKSVHSMRFLNLFYAYPSVTFANAVNTFDRLLGVVKTHPSYISTIACACFYLSTLNSSRKRPPSSNQLVKMTQCCGQPSDLDCIRNLIATKLDLKMCEEAITAFTFLAQFHDVYISRHFHSPADRRLQSDRLVSVLQPQLEVLICQSPFSRFRVDIQALALLYLHAESECHVPYDQYYNTILELQQYCQISHADFTNCLDLAIGYLTAYKGTVTRKPSSRALRLVWSMSRRTMSKVRPSTKISLDLEPIIEDEIMSQVITESDDSSDNGLFDSENDLDTLPTELLIAKGFRL